VAADIMAAAAAIAAAAAAGLPTLTFPVHQLLSMR